MNSLDKLLPFIQFGLFIKIGFLALDLFFILFLLIAVRQVFAMNTIISDATNATTIKGAIILLLLLSISLFLTALVIL
jgi:hypothetical protein